MAVRRDEDIQPAKLADGAPECLLGLHRVGQVRFDRERLRTAPRQPRNHVVDIRAPADGHDGDTATVQVCYEGGTDPAPAACDNGPFPFQQLLVHRGPHVSSNFTFAATLAV